ncbi:MAG TPA: alpha-ketoglutarate-dependent dioxygenase AlkB [Acidimicrobiales bacterium]|nr:alpha-ketoglutarate-dependent dioxygenase AlkB [Acidimicrobiales bacterium]
MDRGRQPSLFELDGAVEPRSLDVGLEHLDLGAGAWLELRRQWVDGADRLFGHLLETVPWREEERVMYDRMVSVPRLIATYGEDERFPHHGLGVARQILNEHYGDSSGGPLRSLGVCLYRDGRDSVAWHGDRIGRQHDADTLVAVVSLGASRRLRLRPRGGGPSRHFDLGSGDLLVMGGSCQRTWEHTVPKTARPCGPRISVQFRSEAPDG